MLFFRTIFAPMFTLKKSLGQHFLKDEQVCQRIVDALHPVRFRNLIEVGPGGGALTHYLVDLPGIDFKAVELDEEKIVYLKKTYPQIENNIIHQNFLELQQPFDEHFAVIGNFPYNISTEIVFKLIEWRQHVDGMVGMFQKEVAMRLASKEGSKVYGVTSVLTQAFFDVEYLFDVDPSCFNPPPKVMSGVIRLLPKHSQVVIKDERKLFVLVKTAFNQRRKTLRNAVRSLFDESVLQEDLFNRRAEQLSVAEFAALTFRMR